MKHVDVRPDLAQVIQGPRSTATAGTKPHGLKVMVDGEDTQWTDDAGVTHSVRQIPTLMEQLATDLGNGVSTASRMNTVSTADPGAADGYPDGAIWTKVELVDGDLVERDRWTLQSGSWTRVGLDASRLVTGTVDAGLIDTVALAAHLITAGLIRTSAAGQRVELTADGLTLWLVDADGQEHQGVRIGPTGATLVTVGTVTIAPTSVTAPAGAFTSLSIAGKPAADYVADQVAVAAPRLVAIGGAGQASGGTVGIDAGSTVGIFDVIVPAVRAASWYRAEIELVTYPRGTDAEIVVYLRASRSDQGVNNASPLVTARSHAGTMSGSTWGQKHLTMWFKGSQMSAVSDGADGRLLLSVYSNARIDVNAETTMAVYCEQSTVPLTSTINRGGAPEVGSTTSTTPPAATQVQTYVKTYAATGSTTYYDSDNHVYSGSTDVIQGSYDGSNGSRRHGAWWFPDMTGDLAGATIQNVEIFVDNISTYADGGGTGHFYSHNGTNAAGQNIMNASFTRGQDRWLPIPSTYWDGFKNGSIRGFMAYVNSSSQSEYARFAGGSSSAQIRITYQK